MTKTLPNELSFRDTVLQSSHLQDSNSFGGLTPTPLYSFRLRDQIPSTIYLTLHIWWYIAVYTIMWYSFLLTITDFNIFFRIPAVMPYDLSVRWTVCSHVQALWWHEGNVFFFMSWSAFWMFWLTPAVKLSSSTLSQAICTSLFYSQSPFSYLFTRVCLDLHYEVHSVCKSHRLSAVNLD
jgi:hypothetical protein